MRLALRVTFCVAVFLVAFFALAVMPITAQEENPPFDPEEIPLPTSPILAGGGRLLYFENCAPCHGLTGGADGPSSGGLPAPPPRFDRPPAMLESSPAQLFHTTKFGRIENLMPPWGNRLSDEQIWRAVMYAWSLHTTPEVIEEGMTLYQESCASCHGPQGEGADDGSGPALAFGAALERSYLASNASWLGGWTEAHSEIGNDWSLDTRLQVLEALRSFAYVPPWNADIPDGPGQIEGLVEAGFELPSQSSVVTLQAFLDGSPVGAISTTLDMDAQFGFQNLSIDEEIVYLASLSYDGVTYSSEPVSLTGAEERQSLVLNVFESSSDDEGVFVAQMAYIVDPQPGFLTVRQIVILGNRGETTFVGDAAGEDRPITVQIPIPEGAQDVRFDGGELGGRFVEQDEILFDTAAIPPGDATHEISLSYLLPFEDEEMEIAQDLAYDVEQLSLLVVQNPEQNVGIPGTDFAQETELDGVTYRIWQRDDIGAGPFTFALEGLPLGIVPDSGSGLDPTRDPTPPLPSWLVPGFGLVLATLLLGALLYFLRRRSGESEEELSVQREDLLRRIAALDDLYERGEIDQSEYSRRRAELKTRLMTEF